MTVDQARQHLHSVWAMLLVSSQSELDVHTFFLTDIGLKRRYLKFQLHLSVYHARRPLLGLCDYEEAIDIAIASRDLRFMVMAPGGENLRPDIDPTLNPIGARVRRDSPDMKDILALRARFYPYEGPHVLGARQPSTERRNAFGARHYQPHVTFLRRGSGIDPDLSKVASAFRTSITALHFDRFIVRCRAKSSPANPNLTPPLTTSASA
jgi:hypothetical protein